MKLTKNELKKIIDNFETNGFGEIIAGKEIEIDKKSGKNYRRGKIVKVSNEDNSTFITIIMNKPLNGKKKHQFQILESSQAKSWDFKCLSCNLRFITKQ